jgi:ABC-type Mn2+/Zn2+ transport system ATPase subunit
MPPLISIEDAALGYGRRSVLTAVHFDVRPGDFLAIVGPNGAGKTTLLKTVLGLLRPLSGTVRRAEADLPIGYVPQRESVNALFPLTVLDVVLMGRYPRLRATRRPGTEDHGAALRALAQVEVEDLASRSYRELSGGQMQRVLIARALSGDPRLLVLDEPTSAMDLAGEHAMMGLLRRLHDRDGMTIVMVSHMLTTVVNYAQRIAIVGSGVVREGAVAEMVTSDNLSALFGVRVEVRNLEGRAVILPGVESVQGDIAG